MSQDHRQQVPETEQASKQRIEIVLDMSKKQEGGNMAAPIASPAEKFHELSMGEKRR